MIDPLNTPARVLPLLSLDPVSVHRSKSRAELPGDLFFAQSLCLQGNDSCTSAIRLLPSNPASRVIRRYWLKPPSA